MKVVTHNWMCWELTVFPRSLSSVCEAVGAFGFCLPVFLAAWEREWAVRWWSSAVCRAFSWAELIGRLLGAERKKGSDCAHQPGLCAATPSPFPVCFYLVGFSWAILLVGLLPPLCQSVLCFFLSQQSSRRPSMFPGLCYLTILFSPSNMNTGFCSANRASSVIV